jgi:peptidoglycan/xylan/chitin deacetylase (PgdA/CDA1 family)
MRASLKRLAESALGRGPVAAAGRRRLRGRTIVLAWHDVVPDTAPAAGDRSLHLPFSRFRAQLDRLVATHDVVPLAAIHAHPARGRPRAAITFDDAYVGAVELALPELVRRGLPATVFVTAGRLGSTFWWDRYAGPDGLEDSLRAECLGRFGGDEARIGERATQASWPAADLPPRLRSATEDELRAAARLPGVTLGAHTWTHPSLPACDGERLRDELVRPLDWLLQRFGNTIPWLAYPYGHADARIAAAAAAAGYAGAFLVSGGYLDAGFAPHLLPRYNVPAGLSPDGFAARLAGWLL